MLTLCHNYFQVSPNSKNTKDVVQHYSKKKFVFGVFILLLVVVLWVVSSELTKVKNTINLHILKNSIVLLCNLFFTVSVCWEENRKTISCYICAQFTIIYLSDSAMFFTSYKRPLPPCRLHGKALLIKFFNNSFSIHIYIYLYSA